MYYDNKSAFYFKQYGTQIIVGIVCLIIVISGLFLYFKINDNTQQNTTVTANTQENNVETDSQTNVTEDDSILPEELRSLSAGQKTTVKVATVEDECVLTLIAGNQRIKAKLNIWLESIMKEKDVYKAIKRFEKIFDGEYVINCDEDIEEDYYEEYIDTYYLKNKMKIVHNSGPQDKFGNMTSHDGDDLFIYSELSNNKEFAQNGVCIFYESEYQEEEIEKLKNLINEDMGFKAVYGFIKDNKLYV